MYNLESMTDDELIGAIRKEEAIDTLSANLQMALKIL